MRRSWWIFLLPYIVVLLACQRAETGYERFLVAKNDTPFQLRELPLSERAAIGGFTYFLGCAVHYTGTRVTTIDVTINNCTQRDIDVQLPGKLETLAKGEIGYYQLNWDQMFEVRISQEGTVLLTIVAKPISEPGVYPPVDGT